MGKVILFILKMDKQVLKDTKYQNIVEPVYQI